MGAVFSVTSTHSSGPWELSEPRQPPPKPKRCALRLLGPYGGNWNPLPGGLRVMYWGLEVLWPTGNKI